MYFNRIYWFYDFLAKLVFGNTLEKAKRALLFILKEGDHVLIVGGGTGAILTYMDSLGIKLTIDFIEPSQGMIGKAKMRHVNNLQLAFYGKPIEAFDGESYDVIITEFFLDLFEGKKIENLLFKIEPMLKERGYWIDIDFRKPRKVYHKVLLKLMFIFFHWSVNMKANSLQSTESLFLKRGIATKKEVSFMDSFVTSRLLCRS